MGPPPHTKNAHLRSDNTTAVTPPLPPSPAISKNWVGPATDDDAVIRVPRDVAAIQPPARINVGDEHPVALPVVNPAEHHQSVISISQPIIGMVATCPARILRRRRQWQRRSGGGARGVRG